MQLMRNTREELTRADWIGAPSVLVEAPRLAQRVIGLTLRTVSKGLRCAARYPPLWLSFKGIADDPLAAP
jgi:hypothetical protein